ncbi:hypothetical protein RMSM_00238 [Rhodopirellula maiorica SM1]|uniref:Uncharacterized protein n=1 Tax=Rhodopirellula maiorica SM1 TaxID=1265738 RepID=M5S9I3_9BACT|nr:hypothetical protein RMSM_00238 [Rhodopirellula maiorica SM1]
MHRQSVAICFVRGTARPPNAIYFGKKQVAFVAVRRGASLGLNRTFYSPQPDSSRPMPSAFVVGLARVPGVSTTKMGILANPTT